MTAKPLAIHGGKPLFDSTLPVGQRYVPPSEELNVQLREIFERQYYTENGPLVQELEAKLGDYAQVRHAICVANASVACLMLIDTLQGRGRLLVPALATDSLVESFAWFSHSHILYDIDPSTKQVSPQSIASSLNAETTGIFLIDYWSGAADITAIRSELSRAKTRIFSDSTQSFGGWSTTGMIGSLCDASIVSMHHTSILSSGEGACIFTDDTDLADTLRTMRSSSGITRPMPVYRTVNGRMSEAQAALGLTSLAHLSEIKQANRRRYQIYKELLRGIPGISPVLPHGVSESNHEHLVCEVDPILFGMPARMLRRVLDAEHVDTALPVRSVPAQAEENQAPLAGANRLADSLLRLPSGSLITDLEIVALCDLLRRIFAQAEAIKQFSAHNKEEIPQCSS